MKGKELIKGMGNGKIIYIIEYVFYLIKQKMIFDILLYIYQKNELGLCVEEWIYIVLVNGKRHNLIKVK